MSLGGLRLRAGGLAAVGRGLRLSGCGRGRRCANYQQQQCRGVVGFAEAVDQALQSTNIPGMGVTQHLGPGSECPALKPGTLRLYSMKFCPYAERTRLVLAAKNIPHEEVNIRLDKKPEWYLEKYPTGKVPALELEGKFVPESLITCDLLDELYPEPALQHSDPWQRARDRVLVDQFSVCTSALHKMIFARDNHEMIRELGEKFNKGIAPFEAELIRRGTPFFHGERPGMLDLMIWPWMERFPAARKLGMTNLPTGEMPPPPPEIQNLHKWIMRMAEQPDVKSVTISTENHMKYIKSHLTGGPDYEMDS